MNFVDYFEKLEKLQRWAVGDLQNASIYAKANFLVAMGLFNYIEILGSFYEFSNRLGCGGRRFDFAINDLFNPAYKSVSENIKSILGIDSYNCLRCGMSHEYLVKTYRVKNVSVSVEFTIYGVDTQVAYQSNIMSKNCGIEFLKIDNQYHIRIYNPRLIHDLNLAFEEFKTKLINDESDYRNRFMRRCKDIHFEKFT